MARARSDTFDACIREGEVLQRREKGKSGGGARFFCHKFWQFGIYAYLCGVAQLAREGVVGDRKYDKRRFRTFVVVSQELRNFQTSQQANDSEASAWCVYIHCNI